MLLSLSKFFVWQPAAVEAAETAAPAVASVGTEGNAWTVGRAGRTPALNVL